MALENVILFGLGDGANGEKLVTFGYISKPRPEYPPMRIEGLTTAMGSVSKTAKLGSMSVTTKLGIVSRTTKVQQ